MTPKKEYDKEREYDYRKYTIHCYPLLSIVIQCLIQCRKEHCP